MVNYKKLNNGMVIFKKRTLHKKYISYRYYKANKNKNKMFKTQLITKKEYERLNKGFG